MLGLSIGIVFLTPIILFAFLPFYLILHLIGRKKRSFTPTSIVITGGSSGIGRGLALAHSAPGTTISITGRNTARLEETKAACEAKGAKVNLGVLDVTDKEGMEKWLLKIDGETPIDLVIANAGVTAATSGFKTDLAGATRALFAINVDGVFNTILPLMPMMKERKKGQIAIMSSVAGNQPMVESVAYAATKASMTCYGEGLRGILYRDGVLVNVITPGFVKSNMTAQVSGKMPFLMEEDDAINCMMKGLADDEPVIALPWQMGLLTLSFKALPPWMRHTFQQKRVMPLSNYFGPRRNKEGAKKEE